MTLNKTAIITPNAPNPLPNILTPAIVAANGTVYCSGQVGTDVKTGKIVEGDVGDRTRQCLHNLSAVLEAAGTSMDDVVKVNVFLDDMANFAKMNDVYAKFFGHIKPARTCVAVKTLPMGTDVEIECVAIVSKAKL